MKMNTQMAMWKKTCSKEQRANTNLLRMKFDVISMKRLNSLP